MSRPNGLKPKPKLYNFINVRPERFGALVYNPYLGMEETLDHEAAYGTALCDGRRSLDQIRAEVGRRYGLAPAVAGKRIGKVLERLGRMSAFRFVDGPEEQRPPRPDVPVFPAGGPFLSAPKNVVWDVSYLCNLRCDHCLTASGRRAPDELTTDEALALVDALAEAKVFSISLSGGEPLMRNDILTLIQRITDSNIRVDIATNGTYLPEPMLERLAELPVFQVQVSIDGLGADHDRFRGRKGTFDLACQAVQRLRNCGIQVGLGMTVTSDNLNSIDSIIELAVDLGCVAFKAIPFLPAGRGQDHRSLGLDQAGHRRLGETITARSRELEGRLNITTVTTFPFLFDGPPATTRSVSERTVRPILARSCRISRSAISCSSLCESSGPRHRRCIGFARSRNRTWLIRVADVSTHRWTAAAAVAPPHSCDTAICWQPIRRASNPLPLRPFQLQYSWANRQGEVDRLL